MKGKNLLKSIILLLFITGTSISCSRRKSVTEFKEYIQNSKNGLVYSFEMNEGKLANLQYFPSAILKNSKEDNMAYFQLISAIKDTYYSESDFEIVSSKGKKVNASIVIMENEGFGQLSVMIGFPKYVLLDDFNFIIKNNQSQNIKFFFKASDINYIEQTKLKS